MISRVARRRWMFGAVAIVVVVLAVIVIGRLDGPLRRPAAGATPSTVPPIPTQTSSPSSTARASTPEPKASSTPKSKATAKAKPSKPSASRTVKAQPKAGPKSTTATAAPTAAGKPRPGKPPKAGTGKTVPVEPVKIKSPVPLDRSASLGSGLVTELSKITAVEGKAVAPGEIAGDALRLDLVVHNNTAADVDLDGLLVVVSYGKAHTPASELRSAGHPLLGTVAAGGSGTGRYVFTVPKAQRKQLRVEVSYSGEDPTVAFEGPANG